MDDPKGGTHVAEENCFFCQNCWKVYCKSGTLEYQREKGRIRGFGMCNDCKLKMGNNVSGTTQSNVSITVSLWNGNMIKEVANEVYGNVEDDQSGNCQIVHKEGNSINKDDSSPKHTAANQNGETHAKEGNSGDTPENTQSVPHPNGKKPYTCWCGKIFYNSASLYMHKDIHTGDRPYVCESCGKSFYFKQQLQKHELIHSEVNGKCD